MTAVFLPQLSGTQIAYFVRAPYYVVIRGLSGSTVFFHIPKNNIFRKNLLRIKCVCFDFLHNF